MKTFPIILALALLAFGRVSAQVNVDVTLNQEEFLPGESLPVAVKITNRSGQQMHLGAEANWLTFSVESADGFVVNKNSEVPVAGAFDLESSQLAIKRVDLAPYFALTRPGRYKITATLHVKDWSVEITGAPVTFEVVTGAKLWAEDFGVPATNGAPVMRRFTLEKVSYLHSQSRLYVQLSDPTESLIFKTAALGMAVAWGVPEAQVDRFSQLHVLWQSGAESFIYCVVNPDGSVQQTDTYDQFNTRPRLTVNGDGDVLVVGGVRRPKPGDLPVMSPPVEMPAPAK